ncbi:MAG: YHS domain-containing protein [Ectothiorhodospiraceae bacterium]|nr:YHS domain-containing protein [Chromatiales bacterium]MCP5153593.1 YHS domain-containing protein [Ectothiorhodospiraceae bacterium]
MNRNIWPCSIVRRLTLGFSLFAAALSISPGAVSASSEVNVTDGAAVHGYDVVAYFTEGRPVEGDAALGAQHEGVTYHFASAANRDAFRTDPTRYVPQYGGYCAFGTAMGRKFDGDPNAWSIVDGKLYLNLNAKVQARWKENIPGFIRGADNNWPIIRGIEDAVLEKSPPSGLTAGAQ